MKTIVFSLLPALLLSLAQLSPAADSLSETLQKGLFEEEANHNLEGAIKAYQSVLQQTDEQRKLAATAVFRLGECYRKLGKTNEASAQYERILREFGDQAELAGLSRQHLPLRTSPETLEWAKATAELARLRTLYSDKHPRVQEQLAVVQSLERSAASRPVEGAIAPTDEEQKEVQRIKALIKDSPDLINARGGPSTSYNATRLHLAAEAGRLVVAQFLLANGAEVDALDDRNYTPLHLAAERGHKSMVELLLAHKAAVDPKQNPTTPLHLAGANGHKLVASVLLAHGANLNARAGAGGWTPLHSAAARGYKSVAEVLLENKADVNAATTADGSDGSLPSYPAGSTPLHLAAAKGDDATVEWLCAHGADVNVKNKSGFTPLHYAVRAGGGREGLVEALLAKKAEVNAKNSFGATPLLIAAMYGGAGIMEVLLAHGADVNAEDEKRNSPLHEAVARNHEDAVKVLLAHKPNLEMRDEGGMTPLQRAVVNHSEKMVELLLDAGASPNVESSGETPLHWAASSKSKKILELLLAHHANVNAQSHAGQTPYDLVKVTRAPRPGTSEVDDARLQAEIAELLRKAGANEDMQRLSVISLSRTAQKWKEARFFKGTNDNRYTLLELLSNFFEIRNTLPYDQAQAALRFPDFSSLTIQRLKPDGGTEQIRVNLEEAIKTGDCSKDPQLQWGDIVEVPEGDHLVDERWPGLSEEVQSFLRKCLERKVTLIVKGESTNFTLHPRFGPGTPDAKVLFTFRLRNVVYGSRLLLASSDTTRVKVTRKDPASGQLREMVFNLEKTADANTDLWLRDGDVIEVPEK